MEILKQHPQALEALEKISEKLNFEDYSITNIQTNTKGEGFMGEIIFVTLEDTKSGKSQDLVLKLAPDHAKARRCFQNEIFFYEKIIPEYEKLLQEVRNETMFAPKCFYTSLQEAREILAFENLKTLDFEMFEKTSELDHDHVKLIFETYGKFHGLSFALQKFKPEDYERISGILDNIFAPLSDGFEKAFRAWFVEGENSLIPGEDDDIKAAFKKFQEKDLFNLFAEITRNTKHSVILHGDCWSSNMIFKYKDSKLVDLRLFDFQLAKTGSAACDLSYCLYSGGSREVFDRLDDYLMVYHKSCGSLLNQFGLDIQEIFPIEALIEEWKEFAVYGFLMSFPIIRTKFVKSEDVIKMKDSDESSASSFTKMKFDVEKYNRRMREIMRHLFKIGVLK